MTARRVLKLGTLLIGAVPMFALLNAAHAGYVTLPVSTADAASALMVDTSGKCPKEPMSPGLDSPVCRQTKFGNAVTDNFHIPRGAWGVAWAFRCSKPDDFYAVGHMPGMDGILPMTKVFRHGLRGHGYTMETHNWQETYYATPKIWRDPVNFVVSSTCAWHLRVVEGNKSTVAKYVPAFPSSP